MMMMCVSLSDLQKDMTEQSNTVFSGNLNHACLCLNHDLDRGWSVCLKLTLKFDYCSVSLSLKEE